MTKWFVTVGTEITYEVEANSREEAEQKAEELYDPTSEHPQIFDSWSDDEDFE